MRPRPQVARPQRKRLWVEATLTERAAVRWVAKTVGINRNVVLRRYSLNQVMQMYKDRSTAAVAVGA